MQPSLELFQPSESIDKIDFVSGAVILIDKPKSWTSFDVVNKLKSLIRHRYNLKKIKVGHAGTLDPMATGLLIVCTGRYTKHLDAFQAQTKVYSGTLKLGATTPSYDAETPVDAEFPFEHIQAEDVYQATMQFTGEVEQYPPIFSALKVGGKAAYHLARAGKPVELASRQVRIDAFNISGINLPDVEFEVVCSKGTYIRSLAHDFGKALKSGAYLTALRRTQIGEFKLDNAWQMVNLIAIFKDQAPSM